MGPERLLIVALIAGLASVFPAPVQPDTTAITPDDVHPSGYTECVAATDSIQTRMLLDVAGTRWFIYQAWDAVVLKELPASDSGGPRLRIDHPRRPDTAQLGFQSPILTFGRIKVLGLYHRMVSPDTVRAWSAALNERDTVVVDTARSSIPLQGVCASPPLVDAWLIRYRDDWESTGFSIGPGRRTRWLSFTCARERRLEPESLADEGWRFDEVPCRAVENDRLGATLRTGPLFDRCEALAEWWLWSASGFGVASCFSGAVRAAIGGFSLRTHGRYATPGFRAPDGDRPASPVSVSAEVSRDTGKRPFFASLRVEGSGAATDPVETWVASPRIALRTRRAVRIDAGAVVDVAGRGGRPRSWTAEEALAFSDRSSLVRFETSTRHGDQAPPTTIDLEVTLRTRRRAASLNGDITYCLADKAWTDAAVRIEIGDTRGLSATVAVGATHLQAPKTLIDFVAASDYTAKLALRYRWK